MRHIKELMAESRIKSYKLDQSLREELVVILHELIYGKNNKYFKNLMKYEQNNLEALYNDLDNNKKYPNFDFGKYDSNDLEVLEQSLKWIVENDNYIDDSVIQEVLGILEYILY